MEKLILKISLLCSIFVLSACGVVETEDISGLDPYDIVSGAFDKADSEEISGIGTILFSSPLASSSRSMALKAQLDGTISNSWVAATFYSSDSGLAANNGLVVRFDRSGVNVIGSVTFNGTTVQMNSSRLSAYFPASLDVIIDVKNTSPKARVLIWRRDMVTYSVASADINTDSATDVSGALPNQRGAGLYAGLTVNNATVTAAKISVAKVY